MADKDKDKKVKISIDEPKQGAIGGTLTLDQGVVEVIAGLAARSITGINRLGKSRLIRIGDNPKRGVSAEVGSKQAALDIDVVIDYGIDIREVAGKLRGAVAKEVGKMAGRDVIEVNLHVVGIQLPESEVVPAKPAPARVQ